MRITIATYAGNEGQPSYATITQGEPCSTPTLITQARGRDVGAAVADAVAKFRTTRTLRRLDDKARAELLAMAAVTG